MQETLLANSYKRKSGIPSVDVVPWGTSLCQFYQNKDDLFDIVVPYLQTGLRSNEVCVWVTSGQAEAEEAAQAMKEAVPRFKTYLNKGQIEIIPYSRWRSEAKSENILISKIDKAVTSGFDSLRIAFSAYSKKKGTRALKAYTDANQISNLNVIAMFAYPRDEFDAVGLMEVVKQHRCALIRDSGKWEVIESSEAVKVGDALKRSEQAYHSLFDNMLEGYAYCHMIFKNGRPQDFVYLAVNDSFERLTGLKNVVGKRVSQVIPGIRQSNPELLEIYGRVALSGRPEKFETLLPQLDSWLAISVFSSEKGTFTALFDNITDRKKAEESLKQYSRELEASNKELESFSYTVSHDLRAPLRSIDGFSQILLEDYAEQLDAKGKEYLHRIRSSSQLMAQLIDDILGLSKVIRTDLKQVKVDLSAAAVKICENLGRSQPQRRIECTVYPGVEVYGDASLLQLALENLLGNAFKYTSRRDIGRIEFGSTEKNGQPVYYVRDNGAGFDMAYVNNLFQPFRRLHSAAEFPGTGIGLATVQKIIQRHGGKVWAEAAVDKGATFYFTLADKPISLD